MKTKDHLFKKGNKIASKNKGKPKKRTLEWEAFGKQLLSGGLDRANEIMKNSNDEKFMHYFLQLLEYFRPKQSRVENETQAEMKLIIEKKVVKKPTLKND